MAIDFKGTTTTNLPTGMKPSGFTEPTVATFDDAEYVQTGLKLSVAKATVENSDRATTLANIIDNGTVGIDKQIEDKITAEFDSTKDVVGYADLVKLESNIPPSAASSSEFLTDTAVAYIATVNIYVKSTAP